VYHQLQIKQKAFLCTAEQTAWKSLSRETSIKTNEQNPTNVQIPRFTTPASIHPVMRRTSIFTFWTTTFLLIGTGQLEDLNKKCLSRMFLKSYVPTFSSKSGRPWRSGNEKPNYTVHPNIKTRIFSQTIIRKKMTFPKPVLLLSLDKDCIYSGGPCR
jgi:hypothetical protein